MPTTSNFGWTTPADTDLVKDGAAAIRTLGNGIDTSLVDLKGGTSGQVLSKNTNTDMDFTWVTPNDADAIQNSIVDAKGDLISATADNTPARLASSGVNGNVLTVDTSTSTGLKWAAPAGGDIKLISRQNVSNVAQIDFEGVFTSTYETYFLIAENVWGSSSGADLQAQMMYSTNTVDAADYYGAHSRLTYQINGLNTGYNGSSTMGLALASLATSQNDGTAVFATITGVGNRSERTLLHGHAAGYQAPLALINFAYFSTQRIYTGIRIKASSGNIYGRVAIYGLAK